MIHNCHENWVFAEEAKAEEEGKEEGYNAVTQTSKGEQAIGESLSGRAGQGERPVWSYLG